MNLLRSNGRGGTACDPDPVPEAQGPEAVPGGPARWGAPTARVRLGVHVSRYRAVPWWFGPASSRNPPPIPHPHADGARFEMNTFRIATLLLAGLPAVAQAQTSQQCYQDSVPVSTTNWQEQMSVPQFDPALGTLVSVDITLSGTISGEAKAENLSPSPGMLDFMYQAEIELFDIGGTSLIVTTPQLNLQDNVTGYDGTTDFGGTSGVTHGNLSVSDSDGASAPADVPLADFIGLGTLTLDVDARGTSTVSGPGNVVSQFITNAEATLDVCYNYIAADPGPDGPDCTGIDRRRPGSLLLFPEFDNRQGMATLITITNVGGPEIDAHFVYIDGDNCQEFDRDVRLTPNDTITLITPFHNPNQERGFLYVYARDTETGEAIVHNHLIGQMMEFDGQAQGAYSYNAVAFKGIGEEGAPTDLDNDDVRDLDGAEYDEAPDQILIPRFIAQTEGNDSDLIFVGLSGGQAFSTTVDFLIYNDNEEVFSNEYTFECWDRVSLLEISNLFGQTFLSNTDNDPTEILGAAGREAGWIRIDGAIAQSSTTVIQDPAFYAVLVEYVNATQAVSDLPFELCLQDNGALLPRGLQGDVD